MLKKCRPLTVWTSDHIRKNLSVLYQGQTLLVTLISSSTTCAAPALIVQSFQILWCSNGIFPIFQGYGPKLCGILLVMLKLSLSVRLFIGFFFWTFAWNSKYTFKYRSNITYYCRQWADVIISTTGEHSYVKRTGANFATHEHEQQASEYAHIPTGTHEMYTRTHINIL